MRISDTNWMQIETYLQRDDRAVVPLGSTEQHAFLSLSTDSILAERVAVDAAQPLGIPAFPVVAYGITPSFLDFPGTVSLRVNTYALLLRDLLGSLAHSGFRRILLVNGHGGNAPADAIATEWMADNPHVQVKYHEWWHAPRTWAKVQEIDPVASHASWMENFPWTRLANVAMPDTQVTLPTRSGEARKVGAAARGYFAEGNFGGVYQRSDEEMLTIWQVAVEETRALLVEGWA